MVTSNGVEVMDMVEVVKLEAPAKIPEESISIPQLIPAKNLLLSFFLCALQLC